MASRWPVRQAVCVGVVLVGLVVPVSGWAQEPASVAFVDEGPIVVEAADLASGVPIEVRNQSGANQSLFARVVGLEVQSDSADQSGGAPPRKQVVAVTPNKLEVDRGASGVFQLVLTDDHDEGVYTGQVVVGGETGPLIRRDVTLTVPAPTPLPTDTSTGQDNTPTLRPGDLTTLTISATNFMPSFLTPTAGVVAVLGALLILAGLAILPLGLGSRRIPALAVVAGGLALFVIGATDLVGTDPNDLGGTHDINASSVPIAHENGQVGTVANDDGGIASLNVTDNEMTPDGLTAAGAYTGQIDLDPAADAGTVATTVNVRDWWPWAFVTLAAGVGLGYVLRRWFQRERPAAQYWLRLESVVSELTDSDAAFAERHPGAIGLSIERRFEVHRKLFQQAVDDGDLPTAKTELTWIEGYVNDFLAVRKRVDDLGAWVSQITGDWKKDSFGVQEGEIAITDRYRHLLGDPFDGPELDTDKTLLSGGPAKVAGDLTTEAQSIIELQGSILGGLNRAEDCTSAEAQAKKGALRALGAEALKTVDATKLAEIKASVATALNDLHKVCPDDGKAVQGPVGTVAAAANAGRLATASGSPVADAYPAGLIERLDKHLAAVPKPSEKVKLSYGIRTARGLIVDAVRVGDPVVLRIELPSGELPYRSVKIEPGIGEGAITAPVPATEPRVIEQRVRYDSGGSRTVTVKADFEDQVLASLDLEVSSESRVAAAASELARTDQVMTRVAFILAVGSGLLALYFKDAAWGEPGDYLEAVLWGAVTAEGVRYAVALADKVWPAV